MVLLIQALGAIAGAVVVWSFSFLLFRDFFKNRFPATLVLAMMFLCAINIAPLVLLIPGTEENMIFIHTLFVISTIFSAFAPIFGVLFVSFLMKSAITWWALIFSIVGTVLCTFGFVPGATQILTMSTYIGTILMLGYIFPFGTFLLIFGYIGNLIASFLLVIHFTRVLKIRGEGANKKAVKIFLFFFIAANLIMIALNLLKRTYPEIYGIDSLAWSLVLAVVLLTYRKNPSVFYLIPALVKFIIITTKSGLVIASYDCSQRVDLEKERHPAYGGQLLHSMSHILQQTLPLESEITTISSPKGIVMFEHGEKFSIYLIVDAYSTLWNLLLKSFSTELNRQFGIFIDIQGNVTPEVPDLEQFLVNSWQQYFPIKKPTTIF